MPGDLPGTYYAFSPSVAPGRKEFCTASRTETYFKGYAVVK